MDAKELAFKKEALEHGLAHIAIQNKDAMVELMLNIDETWRAKNEKSFFETELDKVDNGFGKVGAKLGHDSITDHVVVKGTPFDEKLPENWDNADLSDVPEDWMPEKGQSMFTVFDGKIYTSADPDMYVKGKKFPTLRLADMYLDSLNPVERWKPEVGEKYWCFSEGGVHKGEWEGNEEELVDWDFGNVFRTEQQAIAARERVKKALLG